MLELLIALFGGAAILLFLGVKNKENHWLYLLLFASGLIVLVGGFGLLLFVNSSEPFLDENVTYSLETNDMCGLFSDCNFTGNSTGGFSEVDGVYLYNSTPTRVDFNETLLNETIDSRAGGSAGGNNGSVQFNYNGGFLGVSRFGWYDGDSRLVISNNGSFGNQLVVEGSLGNTSFTGNNIDMTRAGSNYITATDWVGSLYLGAGNVHGGVVIRYDTLVNTLYLNNVGVGIYRQARYALDVDGSGYATENFTAPLLATDCINLSGVEVCNWSEVNVSSSGVPAGSEGELQFNSGGAFNASSDLVWDTEEGQLNVTGNIVQSGNMTNPANATWGIYNNGSCIVIGNLAYISEC